mgnify:CR=1 FL=1
MNYETIVTSGDILCYASNRIYSKLIRYFTRGYREKPTLVTHCAILVVKNKEEDVAKNCDVIEALATHGVVKRPFVKGYSEDELKNCYLLHPKNLTSADREKIVRYAKLQIGKPYGFMKIFAQAIDGTLAKILRRRQIHYAKRLFRMEQFPICSYLVAKSYAHAGLDFGVKSDYATPDDIMDYAVDHIDIYSIF